MSNFVLYHRHSALECPTVFAAWSGFRSPLRKSRTISSCAFGAHEIWWTVTATDESAAMKCLPKFIADRTSATRVADLTIP